MKVFNKKIIIVIFCLSLIYVYITVNSVYEFTGASEIINAYKNYNLIRLHLVANSNSPEDQYLKNKLREKINMELKNKPEISYNDSNDLQKIQFLVNKYLEDKGVDYRGKVNFGEHYFPQRTYGNVTLPAGKYKAVKIELGNGQGSNWWCVLFPPLCLSTEGNEENVKQKDKLSNLTSKNNNHDSELKVKKNNSQIKFRFKIAEYINLERINDNVEYLLVKLNNFNPTNFKTEKPEVYD